MRQGTVQIALAEAMREEMRRDEKVICIGLDVGFYGGLLEATAGLYQEFGPRRVIDTPISEMIIAGASVGAAIDGLRPVAEIQHIDWITFAMDAIVNHAAFMPYWSNGQVQIPMVIRTMGGSHTLGAQHSKSLEAWLTHVPGLKVVMPSTPYDAKGLLKAAIRDPNPVIFIEHKLNYRRSGPLPESDYVVPLGEADVKRKGSDITIVATCTSVHESLKAAQTLQGRGIECEIVDPRTLIPLDMSTILGSVAKTGRLLIVHEAWKTGGFGAEIVARVCESSVHLFKSPPVRLCGADTPNPYSPSLESLAVPRQEQIEKCVLNIFEINSSL